MSQLRSSGKRARMKRIQQAAEKLLKQRSINEITMKEFAQEAKVGEATLFRYVGAKLVLLFLVYGDRMDRLLNEIEAEDLRISQQEAERDQDPDFYITRVLNIYGKRCELYMENPENLSIYLRAGFDIENINRWRNLAQGDRSIRLTASILSEAHDAGILDAEVSFGSAGQNCHAIYMHEIDRTPTRELSPNTIWERLAPRLEVQLRPLFRR